MCTEQLVKKAVAYSSEMAKRLHEMPEHSFQEYETTALVRQECLRWGTTLLDIGMETGAVALLDCGRQKTVALRADIDAVPNTDRPRHLCGHDYHTAGLLGAMQVLTALRESLPYNVVFLFQPAEECTRGARAMLDHGLLEKLPHRPMRLFGIHNRPEIPVGRVGVHPGALMAEKTNFRIRFVGKTGHGGNPQLCIDPLAAAAQFVTAAQTVVSRNVDPLEAAVCSVCSLHCGTEENFAPADAVLTGSVRSLSHAVHLRMVERLKTLAQSTAQAFECQVQIEMLPEVPAVYNGPELCAVAARAAEKTVGRAAVVDPKPCLGSEDFAVLGAAIPSFFYWVGSGRADGTSPAWHHVDFKVEEPYLSVAVPLLVHSAMEQ